MSGGSPMTHETVTEDSAMKRHWLGAVVYLLAGVAHGKGWTSGSGL
jgi:hypothetical protein